MDLNHLAILLIELDPENLLDLDEFKKSLVLAKKKARGHLKDILGQACAEIEAWSGHDLESRRAGIVRLGELLEHAMEFSGGSSSGTKSKKPQAVEPEKIKSLKFTLSEEFDADLLNEFIVESMECANIAESAILGWEKDPNNQELLNTIFRGFHTIKGTSSFINLDCVKDMAHKAESMLVRVRDGQENFTRGHADLSLKSLDLIKSILERMKSSGPGKQIELPLGYEELLEALKNFISGTRDSIVNDLSPELAVKKEPRERLTRKDGEASADQVLAASQAPDQTIESTVRVKIDRLDKLLDTVGELVIAQTMVGQDELIVSGKHRELSKKISHAGKIVRELQDLSMILRMVPLKGTFQKMARLARDLSKKNGKKVDFTIEGEDIEIDRNMVDMVADPLVHLIRNAVDHGIETPEERRRIGKSEDARICLTAGHVEGSIMLTVWDDGRGLNRQKILDKAMSRGLIDSVERITEQEVWQMIFQPGFSTAEQVTEVSGRGVGLDVVSQAVEALRGRIEVQSSEGKGCAFIMRMPLTMAITDGMVVRVGSQRYILPIANIQKAVRPVETDIHTVNQRAEMLDFRGELLPVFRLHRLFDIPDAQTELTLGLLVVIGEGQQRCALFVDDLLTQTQVVTKLLGKGINKVQGVAGGAIMSDGTVGLILDTAGIVNMARSD
ncbi:MAG: chemotaxis protein CheA [Smithella sp.]|jgi:two-component system chemotaxis sensor kinase CheA